MSATMMSKEWNKQKKGIPHISNGIHHTCPACYSPIYTSHYHILQTCAFHQSVNLSFTPLKQHTQTWAKEWQSKAPTTMSILNSKRKRVRSCQTNWKTKEQKNWRSSNSQLHIVNTFRFKIVKLRDYSEERFELWTRPCFGFEQNYHCSQYGLCNKIC